MRSSRGGGFGPRAGASVPNTSFGIAEASDSFHIQEPALEEIGLDAVPDNDEGQYTVFAPTDGAFMARLVALNIGAADLLADPDLPTILLYNVTEGRRDSSSVVNAPEIVMANGDTVTVNTIDLNDGQASIATTDSEASNWVIHVIDGVLLPYPASIGPAGVRITQFRRRYSMAPSVRSSSMAASL